MAHHKRKRAKNQRAGCLACKGHKGNGCHELKPRDKRELQDKVPKPHEASK